MLALTRHFIPPLSSDFSFSALCLVGIFVSNSYSHKLRVESQKWLCNQVLWAWSQQLGRHTVSSLCLGKGQGILYHTTTLLPKAVLNTQIFDTLSSAHCFCLSIHFLSRPRVRQPSRLCSWIFFLPHIHIYFFRRAIHLWPGCSNLTSPHPTLNMIFKEVYTHTHTNAL